MVKLPENEPNEDKVPEAVKPNAVKQESPVAVWGNGTLRCGVRGPRTGKKYRFEPGKPMDVDPQDAAVMVARGGWSLEKPKNLK